MEMRNIYRNKKREKMGNIERSREIINITGGNDKPKNVDKK